MCSLSFASLDRFLSLFIVLILRTPYTYISTPPSFTRTARPPHIARQAITIPDGAHHTDLNGGASPHDTPDMLKARATERAIIGRWLEELAAID